MPVFSGIRLRSAVLTGALSIIASLPADAFARGGVHWGYRNPTYGNGIFNIWRYATVWGALSGAGIPRRNVGAPRWAGGGPTPSGHSGGGGWQSRPTDRSVLFPGSSSQLSGSPSRRRGSGQSFAAAAPVGPFRAESEFDPPYYMSYNSYWLMGYWGGGRWGWARWGGDLGVWSMPRWSLGPLYYPSGYGNYQNPFVTKETAATLSFLDYSVPISVGEERLRRATAEPASGKPGDSPESIYDQSWRDLVRTPEMSAGLAAFDAARAAFRKNDLDLALKHSEDALVNLRNDPALHEFRALVLFARGEYAQAAAALYAVLAISPGWNWTTLSSMYGDQAEYSQQLRKLELSRRDRADAADQAFLLAYHYVTCRHIPSARRQLEGVVKLRPEFELPPQLAALLAGADQADAAAGSFESPGDPPELPPEGSASLPEAPALDPSKLAGEWHAERGPDRRIDLTLTDDDRFTWLATQGGQQHRFSGYYGLEGDRLLLAGPAGTVLGHVTFREPDGFLFQLVEKDPADKGVFFHK